MKAFKSKSISIITHSISSYFIYHFVLFLYTIYQAVTCTQSLKLHFLQLLLSHLLKYHQYYQRCNYIKFIRIQWLKQCSYRCSAESERLQPAQSEQQNRGTWHVVQTSKQSSYQCFYCLGLNRKQARFHLHHRWLCHYRTTEFCDDDSLAETWPGLQHPCKGSSTHRLF